mgnify:CR=1 FL=1
MNLSIYAIPGLRVLSREKEDLIACEVFETTLDQLYSKTHKREVVDCRHALLYYWQVVRKISSVQAGKKYNRDHATALFALKKTSGLIETNKKFRMKYEKFINALNPDQDST